MKPLLYSALLALCASASSPVSGVETQPPVKLASSSTATPFLTVGNYVGTWTNGGEGGELRLTLKQDGANWTASASFSFQGEQISTQVRSVTVEGAKIQLTLDWDMQETPGHSRMTGASTGDTIQGSYESKTPSETSTGTWTVTLDRKQ